MEAEGVLGVGFTPPPVGKFSYDLQCSLVPGLVGLRHKVARSLFGIRSTQIRCLKERAQRAFRGDRIAVQKVSVNREHAAEILRPWSILRRVDDDVPDLLRPQLM